MKHIIILLVALLCSDIQAQDLVRIWEGRPGERLSLNFEQFYGLRSGPLSDYNDDGISDIVLQRRGNSTIYIIDGKTRMPADSLEIEQTANVCNGEQVDRFHVSFVRLDPTTSGNKTAVIARRENGRLLGTRSDNRVVMSGGTTMLTFPCSYQLHGFLDRDGDGYLVITMTNLMTNTAEVWALP